MQIRSVASIHQSTPSPPSSEGNMTNPEMPWGFPDQNSPMSAPNPMQNINSGMMQQTHPSGVVTYPGFSDQALVDSTGQSAHSPNSQYPYPGFDANMAQQRQYYPPQQGTRRQSSMPSPSSASLQSMDSPGNERDRLMHENMLLRQRLQTIETNTQMLRQRIAELERAQPGGSRSRAGPSQSLIGTLPAPLESPAISPEMHAQYRRRLEMRTRRFCAPNRAGNALCAWHDSRRERRAYPPRMAPDGFLNCGCSIDEALFEESLARHGVGSYLPGEAVRMDPALRNPLLRLLQQRYGYVDGDFERDRNGNWAQGEGPEKWERELRGGGNPRRREGREGGQ